MPPRAKPFLSLPHGPASAGGPKQAQYIANRQKVGTRITADELEQVQERVAKWKRAHPRAAAATP